MKAQPLHIDWQKNAGGKARFHAIVEATNGYLLSVGETATNTAGGTDGLLVMQDHSTGQLLGEWRFGGAKDDALYAVAQTFDGQFLLAGTTASSGKGSTDAWLILVNDRGEKIWETTLGTPGRDECRQLRLLPDGSALLAGFQNDRKNGDVWLAQIRDRQLVWEKNLGANEFEPPAGLALAADGGIVFCGNTAKKGGSGPGDIYLTKTDARGELHWKKWFGESGWEEVLGLAATRDGGFALAGLTKSKGAGDLDAWLLKTSRDGFRQWDKTFGGINADLANAVLQTDDGGFLIAGASQSQRSGARFSDAWLVQTSAGGELEWEHFAGEDRDDVFQAACHLHDGSLVLAGSFNGASGILLHAADPQATRTAYSGTRDIPVLDVSDPTVATPSGALSPGQRSWLTIQIHNTAGLDLPDLRVTVENAGNGDLVTWSTHYCGFLAKEAVLDVHIPLVARPACAAGSHPLRLVISAGSKAVKSLEKTIAIRQPQPAHLVLAQHRFVPSSTSDEISLGIQLENQGDSSTRSARLQFVCPAGIRPVGASTFIVEAICPSERREFTLVFVKTSQFSGNTVPIECVVEDAGHAVIRKTLEWQIAGKTALIANGPILIWTDPAPHETGTNKVRQTDNQFVFKMTVVSAKPLEPRDFRLQVNGVVTEGAKFNEEDLSPPKRENAQYTYTYRNKVPLQQGHNRVEVLVDGQVSDPLEVEFTPERANLFVLAIGPRHDDLKYTAKDAADFARAFEGQGGAGRLFNQVIVTTRAAPEETDLTGIKQALYDLAYQWDDKQIKPSDVLLVFLSSHGKIVDNRFKILQTGYNPKYERLSVDFKSDILEVLNNINCKKLVFLDACHSGGAKDGYGGLSQAMVDLAKAQPGVSTLTSSGSTEKSYEDPSWENGAFTEALLEAFGDKPCTDANGAFHADSDGDHVLRLGELYDFLRRRVPALVQSILPNAPTTQTPFMPENQLDKNLPLYWTGGN